jgi:hypothetical protein
VRDPSFRRQQLLGCELVKDSFLIGLEGKKLYLMLNEPFQNSS